MVFGTEQGKIFDNKTFKSSKSKVMTNFYKCTKLNGKLPDEKS